MKFLYKIINFIKFVIYIKNEKKTKKQKKMYMFISHVIIVNYYTFFNVSIKHVIHVPIFVNPNCKLLQH